jgi:hypothetical protein
MSRQNCGIGGYRLVELDWSGNSTDQSVVLMA